jgi:hypothetical protein
VYKAFAVQLAGSGVAVALLVALSAWARIARPSPPLTEGRARALLGEDFPGRTISNLWIAIDGAGALGRSGASALVLWRAGDGYVSRNIPWAQALSASFKDGRLTLDMDDQEAPQAHLAFDAWPPKDLVA